MHKPSIVDSLRGLPPRSVREAHVDPDVLRDGRRSGTEDPDPAEMLAPVYEGFVPAVPRTKAEAVELLKRWERSGGSLPMPKGIPAPQWWPCLEAWPHDLPRDAMSYGPSKFRKRWRALLIEATGPFCRLCGHRCTDRASRVAGVVLTIPVKRGGRLHPLNAILVCHSCSHIKGDRTVEEMLYTLRTGYVPAAAVLKDDNEAGFWHRIDGPAARVAEGGVQ